MVFGKPERKNAEVKDNKSPWKKNQNSRAEGRFLKVDQAISVGWGGWGSICSQCLLLLTLAACDRDGLSCELGTWQLRAKMGT